MVNSHFKEKIIKQYPLWYIGVYVYMYTEVGKKNEKCET